MATDQNDPSNPIGPLFWAYGAAILPHVTYLPWWMILCCFGLWGYAFGVRRYDWPAFDRRLLIIMALAGCAGVVLAYGQLLSLESGTSAAAILLALKPFEIRSYRDRVVTLLGIYFLLPARVFVSQGLGVALYMVFAVLFIQAILTRTLHEKGGFGEQLRLSAGIMIQSLPIVFVLFLFFPRLPGGLGFSHTSVQTGFSGTLNPGDVGRIVRNKEVAFRVSFPGAVPRNDRLYWRGLVFWHFDGRTWRPGDKSPNANTTIQAHDRVDYTIIMEPHGHRWVFVLDLPVQAPPWTRFLSDYTIRTFRPVTSTISLDLVSYLEYNTGRAERWNERALILPSRGNPESRRLAEEWAARADSAEDIMKSAADFFRDHEFSYSLSPGRLPRDDSLDAFLFKTRTGFCGHYASAYCFLMRAAGVPARIVAGYQGGRLNPIGGYLIVRQSDAHTWVEVYLPQKGWVRVDPTAMVDSRRLEAGWDLSLLDRNQSAGLAGSRTLGWLALPLEKFGQVWDTANFSWDRFALGFSHSRQRRLLQRIGIETRGWGGRLLALVVGLALAVSVGYVSFLWYKFRRPKTGADPVAAVYGRFMSKLARLGFRRPPHQGPLDFARSVVRMRPDLENPVWEITRIYIHLRYGQNDTGHHLKDLEKAVRKFHPGRNRPHQGDEKV